MKKMIYLWAAFALPLLFVACSDDKNDDPVDPVLKFKEAEVIADPAGGTYTAELESNVAWTVTSKSSNISSLNMESGKGNATLSFFVSPKTGDDVTGKDVIIVDDMISSGESMLDVAKQLKERHAARVFVCTTFGLFTEGFDKFDEYHEKGYIDKVITTNLTYLPPVVKEKPYFVTADMSKFLALIVDSLNHDLTIGAVLNPTDKIHALLKKYNQI